MSLQMFYVVDQVEFWVPLRDDDVFDILAKKYPQETDAVFGLDEPDGVNDPQGVIPRADLLAAVETLLTAFKQKSELTPRQYVFDFEIIPGVPIEGDKEVRGVKLPGKGGRYCLFGGVGQCELREWEAGPGSLLAYKEPLDLRDQTVLETESHGQIKIRSMKKRSPIVGDLNRLSQFLESQSGESVTKRLL
ncbi:MAG: hypothetical protein ABFC77_02160 [Thermoguttaceae bacterium]